MNLMDMEFKEVTNNLGLIEVNTTAAQEYVGKIEQGIRTIKEHGRSVIKNQPFKSLHKQIVVHLIYFVVICLNAFPSDHGISEKYSLCDIVTKREMYFKTH